LKKIIFITIYFFLGGSSIQAQPLMKAPQLSKQKVKQIVEWIRLGFDQKSKEGNISEFDKQGNLVAYYNKNELPRKQLFCKYISKNNMSEKAEWFDSDQMITLYAYKRNVKIEEIKFRGKTYKTFFYENDKHQLIEKKAYTKGLELGNEYLLKERILYNYKKGRLTGEKIFNYNLLINGKSKKYDTSKILHYYKSKSGKRSKTLEYDFDGSLINEKIYEYDSKNRLIKTICHYKIENILTSMEIKYKNGKMWQEITQRPGYKDVKIYVDGRLIRLRSYNEEKIIRIVDYQYFYY